MKWRNCWIYRGLTLKKITRNCWKKFLSLRLECVLIVWMKCLNVTNLMAYKRGFLVMQRYCRKADNVSLRYVTFT